MDPRDIVALGMIIACVLIFGFFGFFFPDWIGISPRKKRDKTPPQKNKGD